MVNTLNVRLSYEKIIKSLLENDEKKQKQTVRQIIENTKPAKIIVLTKALDEPKRRNSTPAKVNASREIRPVRTRPNSPTPYKTNTNLARLFKSSGI